VYAYNIHHDIQIIILHRCYFRNGKQCTSCDQDTSSSIGWITIGACFGIAILGFFVEYFAPSGKIYRRIFIVMESVAMIGLLVLINSQYLAGVLLLLILLAIFVKEHVIFDMYPVLV
jgi:hypothetical protein